MDGPSSEYLQKAFPKLASFQKKNLPLTIKRVGTIDTVKLANMHSHCPDTLAFYQELIRYLSDPSLYEHVPPPSGALKKSGFTSTEEQLMEGHKFRKHSGDVRGLVYGFKVGQYFKGCSRAVWNCYIKEHFERFREIP